MDAAAVERICFALVAQRALEPGSKLAATGWVSERVVIEGCPGFCDDAAYRAMDLLLDALPEIAAGIFSPGYVMTAPSRSWRPDCWTHVDPG